MEHHRTMVDVFNTKRAYTRYCTSEIHIIAFFWEGLLKKIYCTPPAYVDRSIAITISITHEAQIIKIIYSRDWVLCGRPVGYKEDVLPPRSSSRFYSLFNYLATSQ